MLAFHVEHLLSFLDSFRCGHVAGPTGTAESVLALVRLACPACHSRATTPAEMPAGFGSAVRAICRYLAELVHRLAFPALSTDAFATKTSTASTVAKGTPFQSIALTRAKELSALIAANRVTLGFLIHEK